MSNKATSNPTVGPGASAPGRKGWAIRTGAVLLFLLCAVAAGCAEGTQEAAGPTTGPPSAEVQGEAARGDSGEGCRELRTPVALEAGEPRRHEVAATLCGPGKKAAGDTIQVLVSGAGFDRAYWDFPYRPERYSYVRAARRAGIATLSVDRLGSGESGHPPAERVTVESDAFVLHQVVQKARSGSLGPSGFDQVVTVGFSLGGAIAIKEAAEYGDADGVVVTGFIHNSGSAAREFPSAIHPADEDPKFADEELPEGYVTTRPGKRPPLFFDEENAERRAVSLDERLKATNSPAEAEGFAAVAGNPGLSRQIDVPTLVVVGERDRLLCDDPECSAASREHENYGPEAQVSVIPDSGHALNLHRNAPDTFATILTWTRTRFEPAG